VVRNIDFIVTRAFVAYLVSFHFYILYKQLKIYYFSNCYRRNNVVVVVVNGNGSVDCLVFTLYISWLSQKLTHNSIVVAVSSPGKPPQRSAGKS
jgi:hypothetical protein